MRGRKRKTVQDSDDGQVVGPLMKQAWVILPRLGDDAEVEGEWRQRMVDALEIVNAERHAMRTQLEGIRQAWEATNIKRSSIGGQLSNLNHGLEYLAGILWKRMVAARGGPAGG